MGIGYVDLRLKEDRRVFKPGRSAPRSGFSLSRQVGKRTIVAKLFAEPYHGLIIIIFDDVDDRCLVRLLPRKGNAIGLTAAQDGELVLGFRANFGRGMGLTALVIRSLPSGDGLRRVWRPVRHKRDSSVVVPASQAGFLLRLFTKI
jgi:hypothetical protein